MLPAGVRDVELGQVLEDRPPRLNLFVRVVDMGQRLPVPIVVRQIGKVLATGTVDGIGEAGMVRVQFTSVRQNLIGESIEVPDTTREPGNSSWERD